MDCPSHKVIADPDPHDWFNDDDEAVLCTLTQGNPNHNSEGEWHHEKQNEHRCITVMCRPYQKRSECETPPWCPKLPREPKFPLYADNSEYTTDPQTGERVYLPAYKK